MIHHNAKPTLGYPSRSAAVRALRLEGLNTKQIALRIGVTVSTVAALEAYENRKKGSRRISAILPRDVLNGLATCAFKAGMTPDAMAEKLLTIIVRDKMLAAVLDEAS